MTLKHKNRENSDQENNLYQSKLFICNCGKKYKYDQNTEKNTKRSSPFKYISQTLKAQGYF